MANGMPTPKQAAPSNEIPTPATNKLFLCFSSGVNSVSENKLKTGSASSALAIPVIKTKLPETINPAPIYLILL